MQESSPLAVPLASVVAPAPEGPAEPSAIEEPLLAYAVESAPSLIIVVDLQARGVEWADALQSLTKLGRVLAFGPHVWKEQLDLARDAGCDHVLTNGEFYGRLGHWLSASIE